MPVTKKIIERITAAELPERFRKLPYLGSGVDSYVVDYKNNKVLVFSRDIAKIDWLVSSGLGEVVDKINPEPHSKEEVQRYRANRFLDQRDLRTIYVLLADKLEPINRNDNRKIDTLVDNLNFRFRNTKYDAKTDTLTIAHYHNNPRRKTGKDRISEYDKEIKNFSVKYKDIIRKYMHRVGLNFVTQDHFNKFVEYVMKHGGMGHADSYLAFDLHYANVMKTPDGHLVFNDPVVGWETKDEYKNLPEPVVPQNKNPIYEMIAHDEIPERYKKFFEIGEGATSRVLEYDRDHVLMLTRDLPKVHWLVHCGIAEIVDKFWAESTRNSKRFKLYPVYVLLIEKLYRFDQEDSSKVKKIADALETHFTRMSHDKDTDTMTRRRTSDLWKHKINKFSSVTNYSEKYKKIASKIAAALKIKFASKGGLEDFMAFMMKHSASNGNDFIIDIHSNNLMKNRHGEWVLIDPIILDDSRNIEDLELMFPQLDVQRKMVIENIMPDEIPKKYLDLLSSRGKRTTPIGRGMSGIVFNYSKESVLVFTRDVVKTHWLVKSGMAEVVDKYYNESEDIKYHNHLPIYVLEMEKFYPLNNLFEIVQDVNTFFWKHVGNLDYNKDDDQLKMSRPGSIRSRVYKKFSEKAKPMLAKIIRRSKIPMQNAETFERLIDFILEYGSDGFTIDAHNGNFMETRDGKLVFIDPVIWHSVKFAKTPWTNEEDTIRVNKKFPEVPVNRELDQFKEAANEEILSWGAATRGAFRSAVILKDIPKKYREKFSVINKGSTSLLMSSDEKDKITMFTRDLPKVHWLIHAGLGEVIDKFTTDNPGFKNLPVYVLSVDKLYPLSNANVKKANFVREIVYNTLHRHDPVTGKFGISPELSAVFKRIFEQGKANLLLMKMLKKAKLKFYDNRSLLKLAEFVMKNPPDGKYLFDMGAQNFLENADGELIAIDPIYSQEIFNMRGDKVNTRPDDRMRSLEV